MLTSSLEQTPNLLAINPAATALGYATHCVTAACKEWACRMPAKLELNRPVCLSWVSW